VRNLIDTCVYHRGVSACVTDGSDPFYRVCFSRVAHAGSRINFWTFSQTHISKSELKNGHISRFCSVFQVTQVISSAKFSSAEEVDLSFNSWIWIHESDFKGFFFGKETVKRFSIKCSNSGINETTPQTQSNVIWISSKAELEISFLNSLLVMWVWKSHPKIDPATGVIPRRSWLISILTCQIFTTVGCHGVDPSPPPYSSSSWYNHTPTHILILWFLLYFHFFICTSTKVRSFCLPESSRQ